MAKAKAADAEPVEVVDFKVDPEHQDEHGFVSIWNIASTTRKGEVVATRALASKLLNFLCKKECDFVICSTADATYLDEKFEAENKLLYDWKPESEYVDILSQHAEVPAAAFMSFLKTRRFSMKTKYNPRRIDRVEWFTDMWCVG